MEDETGSNIPRTLTEDILKYLEQQEHTGCEEEGWGLSDHDYALMRVRSILEEIVRNVAYRGQLIEEFQARLRAHNQYPLFNLAATIPDFDIDDDLYEGLQFRETLVVSCFLNGQSTLVPKIVGGLCLNVQLAKGSNPLMRKDNALEQKLLKLISESAAAYPSKSGEPQDAEQELQEFAASLEPLYERPRCKFLVHLSSQFDICGQRGGSQITAWVDRNMHTLEEKRTEFIRNDDGTANEKTLYCALQARRYYVRHTSSVEKFEDRKYYSMLKARDFIGEGANFVLMRYLALSRYIGTFELSTMYINGDMCRNIYNCFGPEGGIVNGIKLDLCRINRTIIEECGIIHNCVTILTLSGQIIKQEWEDCDYVLQINPLGHVSNDKPSGSERLLLRKTWEDDMQMFSEYLDYKTNCTKQMKSYLLDHLDFKDMIADYVQATLLMKPENALDFTIKYFEQYCPPKRPSEQTNDEESEDWPLV